MKTSIGFIDILRSRGTLTLKLQKSVDFIFGGSLAMMFSPRHKITMANKNIESILVIRPGGLGDAVFVLKVVRLLKQYYPQVAVDILCQRRNAEVFVKQDVVRHVYTVENSQALRCREYAVIIDTEQWHYLSAILTFFLKASLVIGFESRPNRGKLFNQSIEYDHNAFELINFINLFKCAFPNLPLAQDLQGAYHVDEATRPSIQGYVKNPSIVLSLGASIIERRLSLEQNSQLINGLLAKGLKPILVGGHDVLGMAQQLEDIHKGHITNLVAQLTLTQTAALIEAAGIYIGPDSGLLHLARAIGVKTYGFFGPGNMAKWANTTDRNFNYSLKLSCSPCTVVGYTLMTCGGKIMCLREFIMKDILKDIHDVSHA